MLQQTQVERVVPHYERFIAVFPTPAACAQADQATVVRQWSGLGYNRRALNLHRAATTVVAEHDGGVPRDDAMLRSLAGVGPYTARAVRSFAFGDDVAAVDTNAIRVLTRAVSGSRLDARPGDAVGRPSRPRRALVGIQPDGVRPRCDGVHRGRALAARIAPSAGSAPGAAGTRPLPTRGD